MTSLTLPRRSALPLGKALDIVVPLTIAALAASAAHAGADTTFAPALTKFTYTSCSLYVLNRLGQRGVETWCRYRASSDGSAWLLR